MRIPSGASVPVLTGDEPVDEEDRIVAIGPDGAHEMVGFAIISCMACEDTGRMPVFDPEELEEIHSGTCSRACAFAILYAAAMMKQDEAEGWEEMWPDACEIARNWRLDDISEYTAAALEYNEAVKEGRFNK